MDGGAGQKQMSETLKGSIKQNALLRRERRLLTHEDQGTGISRASDNIVDYAPPAEPIASTLPSNHVRSSVAGCSVDGSEVSQSSSTAASSTCSPITLPTSSTSGSSPPAGLANPIPVELGSVMIYLDYVFPFLFPFYQPSLLETGRQWLLGLLCQNEVSFHIAATLSAYFFSLVQDMHDDCRSLVRDKLVEQMAMALRSIQTTVSAISQHGAQSPLLSRIRIMEEITQLLIVEVTVRRNADWNIHLMPALVLFEEMFRSQGLDHCDPSLAVLLGALPSPFPMGMPQHKPLPCTADQSALVFFVSFLLFVDIVASTTVGNPPALQSYHDSLLCSHGDENCGIRLETVVGFQNWALVAIGNISALYAWKRDAKRSGNFLVVDLVDLAAPISEALEDGLTSLDISATRSQPRKSTDSRLEAYYSRHDRAIDRTTIADITRIWAYAAKIYLSVCLSGWQMSSTDVQTCVVKVLSLLQTIESPAQLRSLSWPVCVAGCLASMNQEDDFRRIIRSMGQLGEFGTLPNALRIMEAVWCSRSALDRNGWDIASCLSILGTPALLL